VLAIAFFVVLAPTSSVVPIATEVGVLSALTIQRTTEYATAEGLWRSTLERWPSRIAHRNLATSLLQLGKGHEMIEHLRATLAEHPEMRAALGQTLFEQNQFDEALVEVQTFLASLWATSTFAATNLPMRSAPITAT
jgi:hypothetical protein